MCYWLQIVVIFSCCGSPVAGMLCLDDQMLLYGAWLDVCVVFYGLFTRCVVLCMYRLNAAW